MLMQRDLPPESQKKLERVVANGVRIERILDQLFDLTHARLAGGVPVAPTAEQDLVPLVSNVVTEMRVAHPSQGFELRTEPPCVMKVDGDRFQQVVSSLLGNAVSHGDRERPITVAVAGGPDGVTVSVHNHGAPIAPALMPILFDPFKRGRTPRDRRPGSLGLGLYITERIVAAHGGTLVVESSQDSGTTFQASFPRRT
jgi:signal transduction histidine kinase